MNFLRPFDESVRRRLASDPFFPRLTRQDLSARGIRVHDLDRGRQQYRTRYVDSLHALTDLELTQMHVITDDGSDSSDSSDTPRWVQQLDARVRPHVPHLPPVSQWIRPVLCWQMAGESVEGGMPHTLQEVIVVPAVARPHLVDHPADMVRMLQHEYIHVLQRAYPSAFREAYGRLWSLRPIRRATVQRLIGEDWLTHRRSNPDCVDWFSHHSTTATTIVGQFYLSGSPASLHDSRVLQLRVVPGRPIHVREIEEPQHRQLEHPHERLATWLIRPA